ncbi:MAG: hypothetical protein WC595_02060 [Candidatus Nanoarchaeia archaeon]
MNEEKFICSKTVELQGEEYLVYLKEVPTRIAVGGQIQRTTIRAFIRKI